MKNTVSLNLSSDQRERVLGNGAAAPNAVQRATLAIKPNGVFIGIYSDGFDYGELGRPRIRRASHVEPNSTGTWLADLSPVDGPVLGPFDKRADALAAEQAWLEEKLCVLHEAKENNRAKIQ